MADVQTANPEPHPELRKAVDDVTAAAYRLFTAYLETCTPEQQAAVTKVLTTGALACDVLSTGSVKIALIHPTQGMLPLFETRREPTPPSTLQA